MKLQELLKDVAVKNSTAAQDIEIKEVRYDSRAVQPGDLFVAIRGYATDGHKVHRQGDGAGRGSRCLRGGAGGRPCSRCGEFPYRAG